MILRRDHEFVKMARGHSERKARPYSTQKWEFLGTHGGKKGAHIKASHPLFA